MVNVPAEVDLVVLGSGAGGMTAALTGAILGMDVLLVEKDQPDRRYQRPVGGKPSGCRTRGTARPMGTASKRPSPICVTPSAIGWTKTAPVAFLRAAPEMVDFLEDNSPVKLRGLSPSPGLPGHPGRRDAVGPPAGAGTVRWRGAGEAVRRPTAAAAGIHAVRRDDGRPHGYRAPDGRDPQPVLLWQGGGACWRAMASTACAMAEARAW